MANYLFRLWVHEAEDGFLPETVVTAESKMPAAALALRNFAAMGRPLTLDAYLESHPRDDQRLRVRQVVEWLATPAGQSFLRAHAGLAGALPSLKVLRASCTHGARRRTFLPVPQAIDVAAEYPPRGRRVDAVLGKGR